MDRDSAPSATWRTAAAAAVLLVAGGCGGGGDGASDPNAAVDVAGRLAAPVTSATVTAHALNPDGSSGAVLTSTTTGADGAFRLTLPAWPAGGVRLAATGGSYASRADLTRTVQGVAWSAALPSVSARGETGLVLSPLSTFVDRRMSVLMGAALPAATALPQADAYVRAVYALPGSDPVHRLQPDDGAASGTGARLAFVLGALEQLALQVARPPADVERAIGDDFVDGALDGRTVGGAAIRWDASTPAPVSLSVGDYLSALAAYLAPTNTRTLLARNGVTPDAATVGALQAGVASSLRFGDGAVGNNGAVLTGATVGRGTTPTGQLRKTIVTSGNAGGLPLLFGTATVMRSSTNSDAYYLSLPVTNVGARMLCFIQLKETAYYDGAGRLLMSGELGHVDGSAGRSGSVTTDTCLSPGETGFAKDIDSSGGYAALARVTFTASASSSSVAPARAALLPQRYTVTAASSSQSLDIAVANVGAGPALTGSSHFSTWTLLDEDSQPLMWGYAADGPAYGNLAVGASATLRDSPVFYDGAARRLLVRVDFDDAGTLGAQSAASRCRADGAATDAYHACMHAARMERTSAALRAAQRDAAR